MKQIMALVFCFALVSLTAEIKVVKAEGIVQIKKDAAGQWTAINAGSSIDPGNFIFTGFNSTAVLEYNDIKIEVKALTQINVASLISDDKNRISDVYLKYGKIKTDVKKIENVKTDFTVRSANSTASVRGTSFVYSDGELIGETGTVQFSNAYFSHALVQRDERFTTHPSSNRLMSQRDALEQLFLPSVKPLGLAGSDDTPLTDTAPGSDGGATELIIKIKVIK